MKREMVVGLSLAAALVIPGRLLAHEGHEHKIMGKVAAIDEKTIVVDSLEGKKVTCMLTSATRFMRDKTAVTRTDVKIGERVVIVVVEEKQAQNVKQVLLGMAAAEAPKAEHKH